MSGNKNILFKSSSLKWRSANYHYEILHCFAHSFVRRKYILNKIAIFDVWSFCFRSQFGSIQSVDQNIEEEEIRARAFLDELNDELNERKNRQTLAEWDFNSNITDANQKRKDEIAAENAVFTKVRILICFIFALKPVLSVFFLFSFCFRAMSLNPMTNVHISSSHFFVNSNYIYDLRYKMNILRFCICSWYYVF